MAVKNYWVCIISNPSRTISTGVTNNLERRLWEHRTGHGSQHAFAHRHGCTHLVFFENFTEILDAIGREKEIKGWSRPKKVKLIEIGNPRWADLSDVWTDDTTPAS